MREISDCGFRIAEDRRAIPKSKIQNPKYAARTVFFLVIIFSALFFPVTAIACPGCKDALFDPGQLPQRLAYAKGYAMSIGLFLLVPVTLIGSIAALILRAQHRRRASGASR